MEASGDHGLRITEGTLGQRVLARSCSDVCGPGDSWHTAVCWRSVQSLLEGATVSGDEDVLAAALLNARGDHGLVGLQLAKFGNPLGPEPGVAALLLQDGVGGARHLLRTRRGRVTGTGYRALQYSAP